MSVDLIKDYLSYDECSGLFRFSLDYHKFKAGDVVGTITKKGNMRNGFFKNISDIKKQNEKRPIRVISYFKKIFRVSFSFQIFLLVLIFNNIFVNYGTGTYTKKDKWQYRHNLYVGHNVPDYETIPDVQPLYSDPQFVNTDFPGTILNKDMETRDVTDWSALNGFQVLMTSPAIDAGVPVSKDSLDFYKNKSGHYANIGLDQKTR